MINRILHYIIRRNRLPFHKQLHGEEQNKYSTPAANPLNYHYVYASKLISSNQADCAQDKPILYSQFELGQH